MIKPWPTVASKPLGDFRIFSLRSDRKLSPRTGVEHDFIVLESRNWVNVIALTSNNHVVMIEQYRHGSNTIELEIPGGIMDPHETCPVDTGVRELCEETGYVGDDAQIIGKVFANPAILNNTAYTILVRNCELKQPVSFDQGEDIVTHLVPIDELPSLVSSGRIGHSIIVAALYHFDNWRRTNR